MKKAFKSKDNNCAESIKEFDKRVSDVFLKYTEKYK